MEIKALASNLGGIRGSALGPARIVTAVLTGKAALSNPNQGKRNGASNGMIQLKKIRQRRSEGQSYCSVLTEEQTHHIVYFMDIPNTWQTLDKAKAFSMSSILCSTDINT
jgi:hypothetical protein